MSEKNFTYPNFNMDIVLTKTELRRNKGNLTYTYKPFQNLKKEEGVLGDFITDKLNFKLTNPVNIEVQPSYDGTVNLILNDDVNPPRLINSRFTVKEDKQYEIIDRKGDEDTNLYEEEIVDQQTRLFKVSNSIPIVDFDGLEQGGALYAGLYTFYFKYIDADGNESDIFAESGMIPVHEGDVNDPETISGGLVNTNCNKLIKLKLSNLDISNDYISVYFIRSTGQDSYYSTQEYVKILDKVVLSGKNMEISITGYENKMKMNPDQLNVEYNLVNKVKTQAQVQNMLFFANVDKPNIEYVELTDLSLRILPGVTDEESIGALDPFYKGDKDDPAFGEYYNMKNVYYRTGYWNNEIYRFGVVYIMKDDSLSPVFNIRGGNNIGRVNSLRSNYPLYNETTKKREYITISEDGYLKDGIGHLENILGVCRLNYENQKLISNSRIHPLAMTFTIPDDVLNELKKHVKGLFFVRQKRIPTILAQGLTIGVDEKSYLPYVCDASGTFIESFMDKDRILTHDFNNRRIKTSNDTDIIPDKKFRGILCPEVNQNKLVYNGIFNNSSIPISNGFFTNKQNYLNSGRRHFYINDYQLLRPLSNLTQGIKVSNVPEGIQVKTLGDFNFSTMAGSAEEGFRVKVINSSDQPTSESTNLTRGIFTGFLGASQDLLPHQIVTLHSPGYDPANMEGYFKIRFNSLSSYSAISNRYDLEKINSEPSTYFTHRQVTADKTHVFTEYRGDCYVNTVTVRMHRNFTDPELPINDDIIDKETWKTNYTGPGETVDPKEDKEVNRSDVNAVNIGHWVTFKVCSTVNMALRSVDNSNLEEKVMHGQGRSFYPYSGLNAASSNKMSESQVYNAGYVNTLPVKQYHLVSDVPYLKNIFDNRIMFSERHVNDAFKNGYRIFQNLQYQDITRQYGGITKILDWNGALLVIFENGIALLPINERALISTESGQSVHMYGAGVLPEKETPISVDYGSRWIESIIRTPNGVYGVDTEAKKIWRVTQQGFEIISELKIQNFLNENILFDQGSHYPVIGLRNVKTHYDNFKGDVIFTFYDCLGGHKTDFNVVFNEKMNNWITRTSWTPIASENINNIFLSFDKDVSHDIALTGYTMKLNENLTLSTSNVFYDDAVTNKYILDCSGGAITAPHVIIGELNIEDSYTDFEILSIEANNQKLHLDNRNPRYMQGEGCPLIPEYAYYFSVCSYTKSPEDDQIIHELIANCDPNSNIPYFITDYKDQLELDPSGRFDFQLTFKCTKKNIIYVQVITPNSEYGELYISTPFERVDKILSEESFYEKLYIQSEESSKDTNLFKHGFANMFVDGIDTNPKPLSWYDKSHPFEFEFIVAKDPSVQKIFNNLKIISNKVKPDQIKVWVTGDSYDFINYTDENSDNYIDKIFPVVQDIKSIKDVGRLRGNAHYKENAWDIELKPGKYVKYNIGTDTPKSAEFRVRDKYAKIRVTYSGNDPIIISLLQTLYTISYS